jgi:hypothetical protein
MQFVSHSDAWTESHLTKNKVNHFSFPFYFFSLILVSSTFLVLYSILSFFFSFSLSNVFIISLYILSLSLYLLYCLPILILVFMSYFFNVFFPPFFPIYLQMTFYLYFLSFASNKGTGTCKWLTRSLSVKVESECIFTLTLLLWHDVYACEHFIRTYLRKWHRIKTWCNLLLHVICQSFIPHSLSGILDLNIHSTLVAYIVVTAGCNNFAGDGNYRLNHRLPLYSLTAGQVDGLQVLVQRFRSGVTLFRYPPHLSPCFRNIINTLPGHGTVFLLHWFLERARNKNTSCTAKTHFVSTWYDQIHSAGLRNAFS